MNELDRNTFPDDVWQGTESHPQCCFFELFPSSQDPYETFYGELFCHMDNTGESAKICKGDYCKCPLDNGAIDSRIEKVLKLIADEIWGGKYIQNDIREYKNQAYQHSMEIIVEYFPEIKNKKVIYKIK